jgi:hypothetical protein
MAEAEPSTQVAAAPASQSVATSPRGYASQSTQAATAPAASPPVAASDSSDPKCQPQYQLIGGWYNPCPEKVSEKVSENVSEATPAATANPEKKKRTATKKQPAHAAAATPASTKVAAEDR